MTTAIFDRQPPVDSRFLEPPSFFKRSTEKIIPKRIVIGGSSANPPHLDHLSLLNDIRFSNSFDFDLLIWVPCGERPDKHFAVCPSCRIGPDEYCHMCSNHRIAMTEMMVGAFRQSVSLPYFSIWYDDIFGMNTPTIVWLEKLAKMYPEAKITWVTGADSVIPQEKFGGQNEIQHEWKEGQRLWESTRWSWLVYQRPGYPLDGYSLPPNVQVAEFQNNRGISSSQIRSLIACGGRVDDRWESMVMPEVAEYIKEWNLYGYKQ